MRISSIGRVLYAAPVTKTGMHGDRLLPSFELLAFSSLRSLAARLA
ncbi:MAG: hypothetical protein IT516_06040 [Burkholderiales bacterium]|nr:hypothetical protein [Burkholderiales bacterium]